MGLLSITEAILNIPLTETPQEIKLPEGISANTCMIVCTLSNEPVNWRRRQTESGTSIMYPAGWVGRGFKLQPGATMFWASTVSGTGTLEIEVLS